MSGRIVLGLGGTVDHELVWDAAVFQALVDHHGIEFAELQGGPSSTATTEREIILAILRSMYGAVGCECYVKDKETLLAFDSHFAHDVTLGGTCVRAALALDRIGIGSTVHLVSISDEVRERLPPSVEWICSADKDSLDPHVIVQYPAGTRIRVSDGTVVVSRPNRVILVNDEPNEHMYLSTELPWVLSRAEAVEASGFNTMKSEAELRQRLGQLEAAFESVAPGVPVVYEDAGFHDDSMRSVVLEVIPRLFSVHSMNEDEAQRYLGRDVDLESPAEVVAMMRDLKELLASPAVLVHTSHYAAVIGTDAERYGIACEAGCLMAATRFVYGDKYGRAEYEAVSRAPRQPIGLELAGAAEVIAAGVWIAPGFVVEADHPTTIGLGDSFIGGVMGSLLDRTVVG